MTPPKTAADLLAAAPTRTLGQWDALVRSWTNAWTGTLAGDDTDPTWRAMFDAIVAARNIVAARQ